MSITRRLFLSQSAAAAAVGDVVAAPAAAEPELMPREWALWHMRELEQLAKADGAGEVCIILSGRPSEGGYTEMKMLILKHDGSLIDEEGMFGGEQS